MTAIEFVVIALAVHRLTRLFVEDTFPPVAKPRQWVVDRNPDGPLAYLVNCFWCASVWTSAVAVLVLYTWHPPQWAGVPMPVGLLLAFSTAASAFQTLLEYLDAKIIGSGG